MQCLVCASLNMKAHVTLEYDVPLTQRNGGIKIAGIKVTQLDLRDAWNKLELRPIWCHDCLAEHLYDVGAGELRLK